MPMPTALALVTPATGGVSGASGGPRPGPGGADMARPFAEWLDQARPPAAPSPSAPSREPAVETPREPERAPAARSQAPAPPPRRDDEARAAEPATGRDDGERTRAGDAPEAAQSRVRDAARQRARASEAQRQAAAADRPTGPVADPAPSVEATPTEGARRIGDTAETTVPVDGTVPGVPPEVTAAVQPAPAADNAIRFDPAEPGAAAATVAGIAPQPTGPGLPAGGSDAAAAVSSAAPGTATGGSAAATSDPAAEIGVRADAEAPKLDGPAAGTVRTDPTASAPAAVAPAAADRTVPVTAADAVAGDRAAPDGSAPTPAGSRDRGPVRSRETAIEGARADLPPSAAALLQRSSLLPAADTASGAPAAMSGLAAAGDSPRSGTEATLAAPGLPPLPVGTASVAAGLVTTYADVGAATLPVTTVAEPLDSPAFGPSLAAQVSVLARDGIERAEIRLNPADMGPVAVQILIDGTQARVEFTAEQAPTRAALEAGLPQLAAALRDAGLTLTGGGVFQHGQGRGRDGGDTAGRGRTGTGAGDRNDRRDGGIALDAAVRPQTLRTGVTGRVDLYA